MARAWDRDRDRDRFAQLPIELIHTIFSFLITPKRFNCFISQWEYQDTKQAVQTIILSKRFLEAWSIFPDLYFTDKTFTKLFEPIRNDAFQIQDYSMSRERFANYVLHTLTRYQKFNIPIRRLHLTAHLQQDDLSLKGLPFVEDNERIVNILDQSIRKATKHGVNEVYLHMLSICPYSNFLQTIFSIKQLVSLHLYRGDLVKKDVLQDCCDIFINCSSLRMLKLEKVGINEALLQKLIQCCPLIEGIQILSCLVIETIQVANLPNLKSLEVFTRENQKVDVKAARLEHMIYRQLYSTYMLSIGTTQNLKILKFECTHVTDAQFHCLIGKCLVLEELRLDSCNGLQKINISSHSLSFLSIINCRGLVEVKIAAPILNMFEFFADLETHIPSLSLSNEGSDKRKSSVTLLLDNLEEASSFLELMSEFLMAFKHSDTISITIISTEISFDRDIMDSLRNQNSIPEFDEVYIRVEELLGTSMYSTLMEGLLWSFSPKIFSVERDSKVDEEFIIHLFKEFLVQHDDHPNISTSTSASDSWRNYFKQAKFHDRDDEWQPLHSLTSLAGVLENLGNHYILKLSHC